MKKMPKIIYLALAMLLLGVLAIPFAQGQSAGTDQGQGNQQEKRVQGWGQGGFGRGHWRRHRFAGRLFSQLNLTDAQKAQMKQLNQNFRANTKSLREELLAKRGELRQ